jgi:phage RecT family recombinase
MTGKAITYVETIRDRVAAVLSPEKPPGRYLAIVAEYLTRNPDLFQCERFSLQEAIVDAAILGLELGSPFDLATIIPYKDRDGRKFATLVVEYRGHMAQVYRTGRVKSIEARPVYKHDTFEYRFGKKPALNHQPTIIGDRGPLVHAYAIAQLTDGGTAFEVINQHDAAKAKADSPGAEKPGSLWKTRTAEMWTKTAIKKLVNRLPRGPSGGSMATSPPWAADYDKLVNAVSVSPELYRQAVADLEVNSLSDPLSIRAVLAYMRTLYRTKTNGPAAGPTDNPQNTTDRPDGAE